MSGSFVGFPAKSQDSETLRSGYGGPGIIRNGYERGRISDQKQKGYDKIPRFEDRPPWPSPMPPA